MTHRFAAAGLLATVLLWAAVPAGAQEAAPVMGQTSAEASALDETLTLTVGDILEILPVHTIHDPKYAWILTQDRTFLQAERSSAFRTRLIQPGTYLLLVEISGNDPGATARRTFHLVVKPRTRPEASPPAAVPADAALGTTLVTTLPKIQTENRIILPAGRQTLLLSPVSQDFKPLSLDMDTRTDTSGDGSPDNDVDNSNSFFQLEATPLILWFASPLQSRTMKITTIGPDGGPLSQSIEILSSDYAREQGLAITPAAIFAQPAGSGSFLFSIAFQDQAPNVPLLYQWNFGDGQESLISRPTYTYKQDGSYTVQLHLRNLVTGQEVASYSLPMTVTVPRAAGSAASTPAQTVESPEEPENSSASGWLRWAILGGGVFGVSIALGLGGMFLLSRLRKRKPLHEALAELEGTILKKEEGQPVTPPLVIEKKETPKPEQPAAPKQTTPPAPAKTDEAPEWLKKSAPTLPPPAPKPAPATPAQPQVVTPVMPPATAAPAAPLPSWLQGPDATVAPLPAVPKPIAPAAPASPPKPAPVPVALPPVTKAPEAPSPVIPAPVIKPTPAAAAKPVSQTPAPAPLQSTPPAPKPTPEPMKQSAPAPVVMKPDAPKVAAPVTPVVPKPIPPQPITPPLAAAPKPTPTPAPAAPTIPTPPAPAQPMVPTPPTLPAQPSTMQSPADPTIAVIRADSLGTPPKPQS